MKGDDPSFVDKTRATLRDLHTQIKVSIHSVEAISKRIETLRDEELEPQLLELVQGYVSPSTNCSYAYIYESMTNILREIFSC